MLRMKSGRKLTNYIIDTKFQLRYILFVTALSGIIYGTLGYLIWQQADVATTIVGGQLSTEQPEIAPEVIATLTSQDTSMAIIMFVAGIGVVLLLSLCVMIMTHKVAGPLYKVALHLDSMAGGRLNRIGPIRRGDMLQTFYKNFMSMHIAVRARHVECNENLKDFITAAEKAGIPQNHSQLNELREHCKQRDDALA